MATLDNLKKTLESLQQIMNLGQHMKKKKKKSKDEESESESESESEEESESESDEEGGKKKKSKSKKSKDGKKSEKKKISEGKKGKKDKDDKKKSDEKQAKRRKKKEEDGGEAAKKKKPSTSGGATSGGTASADKKASTQKKTPSATPGPGAAAVTALATHEPLLSDGELEDFSYDEKRQLSLDIQRLSGDKLSQIAVIIQQHEPSLDMGSGEFEIDFEQLNNRTLRALRDFTTKCLNEKPAKKRKNPSTAPRRQNSTANVAPGTAGISAAPASTATAPPLAQNGHEDDGLSVSESDGESDGSGSAASGTRPAAAPVAMGSALSSSNAAQPVPTRPSGGAGAAGAVGAVAPKSALGTSLANPLVAPTSGISFNVQRQESVPEGPALGSAIAQPEAVSTSKPLVVLNKRYSLLIIFITFFFLSCIRCIIDVFMYLF